MPNGKSHRPRPAKLECPNCHEEQLARIARRGFLRNRIYPIFGLYPWQCAICGRQYLIRKRSAGYRQTSEDTDPARSAPPTTAVLRSR